MAENKNRLMLFIKHFVLLVGLCLLIFLVGVLLDTMNSVLIGYIGAIATFIAGVLYLILEVAFLYKESKGVRLFAFIVLWVLSIAFFFH